jgi:3'(2'), 5'-bisphosphate nucleotidase
MYDEYTQWIDDLTDLAEEAGEGILEYYQDAPIEALNISTKPDNTLLTEADLCAHNIIFSGLQQLAPNIPVLSEEGEVESYLYRQYWERYWLIDPLDGTRGFVEQRDEFTVNIALIESHQPVIGIVYVPIERVCYFAVKGQGAFRKELGGEAELIHARVFDWEEYRVLIGHYQRSPELLKLFESQPGCELLRVNSSLKFVKIAEGEGDCYPRFGDTSEWDTAAAQCVLEEAGGELIDFDGNSLQYNEKPSVINPSFLAMGDMSQTKKMIDLIKTHTGDEL